MEKYTSNSYKPSLPSFNNLMILNNDDKKDDRFYLLEPLIVTSSTSYTGVITYSCVINYNDISITDKAYISQNYYGNLTAVYLGTYFSVSVTYKNKDILDSMGYVYTTNNDNTYTVESERNLEKIGTILIIDANNFPVKLSITKINNINLDSVIKRRNEMIGFCMFNNLHNPYKNHKLFTDDKLYTIGSISLYTNMSVADVPDKLSLLDNY